MVIYVLCIKDEWFLRPIIHNFFAKMLFSLQNSYCTISTYFTNEANSSSRIRSSCKKETELHCKSFPTVIIQMVVIFYNFVLLFLKDKTQRFHLCTLWEKTQFCSQLKLIHSCGQTELHLQFTNKRVASLTNKSR